jgi:hypothetical protein
MQSIPKIIHQLWIGPKERPHKFMDSWRNNNPDFKYIMWNEQEIKKNLKIKCLDKLNAMREINGKADILRWEILYNYGGIFLDADSVSISPLDEHLLSVPAFAAYENEITRPGLIATVAMGFPKNHPLCLAAINWILKNNVTKQPAWISVGPGLITKLYKSYPDVIMFPSHYFLPIHFSKNIYMGHGKVYAHQEWGSTRQKYNIMNSLEIPTILTKPNQSISILINSCNTNILHIKDCLHSIKHQNGHYCIEIVWINNNSTDENTQLLEKELQLFKNTTRFCNVIYRQNEENNSISLCNNDLIFIADPSDIMNVNRIINQINFMNKTPDCILCGSNTIKTIYPSIFTLEDYNKTNLKSFMNCKTLCFRKSEVLELKTDIELLQKYGKIYNIQECLVLCRNSDKKVKFEISE